MNQSRNITMISYAMLCVLLIFSANTIHAGELLRQVVLPESNVVSMEFSPLTTTPVVQQSEEESGEPELTTKELRSRKSEYHGKKYIWLSSAVVSGAVGVYFRYSADKHYKEYQTATDRASELHRLIDLEDTLYPIFYGISAACLLPTLSYHFQEMEVASRLQASSGSDGSMNFSLGATITW